MDMFDPSMADNPFMKRIPELPKAASDAERQIAEKYTRISWAVCVGEPDATNCWLVVGNQSFIVGEVPAENRENASWYCWMIAKALLSILETEGDHE